MHVEPGTADATKRREAYLAAIERAVAGRRAAFHEAKDEAARGPLVDALLQTAGEYFKMANGEAAAAVLVEAEALLPAQVLNDIQWRVRATNLHRAKGAFAQGQDRHADAVAAFASAAALLPADSEGNRDAMAARLQVLVRLARSRLAIGQASETEAEMTQCEAIIEALASSIPSQALDTIRSAVLSHSGAALALLGKQDAAEEKFNASLALIDRIRSPDVATVRQQVTALRADMLSKASAAAATPLPAGSDEQPGLPNGGNDEGQAEGVHQEGVPHGGADPRQGNGRDQP